MPPSKPHKPASPVSGGSFARVDQGVDWNQSSPFRAIGSGTVYQIGHGFAGPAGQPGSDMAVYIKLDHPIRVNGRVYDEIYYAETTPLVREGEHVKAGQAVSAGGDAEIGFASGGSPLAPLVGGLGAGTQSSEAGHDFLDLIQGRATFDYSKHAAEGALTASSFQSDKAGSFSGPSHQPHKASLKEQGFQTSIPTVTQQDQLQPFSPQESLLGDVGTGYTSGLNELTSMPIGKTAQIWQSLAQDQSASPETRLLAQNAGQLTSGMPDFLTSQIAG